MICFASIMLTRKITLLQIEFAIVSVISKERCLRYSATYESDSDFLAKGANFFGLQW